jgi:hypothetical protein
MHTLIKTHTHNTDSQSLLEVLNTACMHVLQKRTKEKLN